MLLDWVKHGDNNDRAQKSSGNQPKPTPTLSQQPINNDLNDQTSPIKD